MRIVNLIENTSAGNGCACEHGLSFYLETAHHKLLVDTGATDAFLENARRLSVDLTQVDTVILSHGHYDHGGGLLAFAAVNPTAKIYARENAFGGFYHAAPPLAKLAHPGGVPLTDAEKKLRYIGLDPAVAALPQLVRVQGNLTLDEELFLFTNVCGTQAKPAGNAELLAERDGMLLPDDFSHEQYLVVTDGKRKLLVSGCAHNGILNILAEYEKVVGGEPDAVISGFHMKKKQGYEAADIAVIEETARRLSGLRTKFFTGHCTGEEPFAQMCAIMGTQLWYVRSGEEVLV